MSHILNRLLAAILLSLVFCMPAYAADDDASDPLEPVNRVVFSLNNGLDIVLFEPVSEGYHWLFPQYARDRVHHIMLNLNEPLSSVNYLLQGNFDQSGQSLTRFMLNSTFGLAGMYDVTGEQSADKQRDFGDTFADWGAGPGPYLVLPLVGPSDLRASAGLLADYYGDPVSITVRADRQDFRDPETVLTIKYGIEYLDTRTRLLRQIDDLRKNSLDFYVAMRSIYIQRRNAKLGEPSQTSVDLPAYK